MRDRPTIEAEVQNIAHKLGGSWESRMNMRVDLELELLLDIRELLSKQKGPDPK
jgi:hypothetical protein